MRFNRTQKIFKSPGVNLAIALGIILFPLFAIVCIFNPNPRTKYVNECKKKGYSECYCFKQYHINKCLEETKNSYSICVEHANDNARALNIQGCDY
jgi:hypothetical protein